MPTPGFFPALRRLCDKHGILLIVDEVQSGMGRTGKWWAIQHWGVEPDMVCIAKGIASGMPLGAMVARKSVMDWPAGAHGNTYGGNPISCAAALATIRLVENGLMDNAAAMGERTMDTLTETMPHHPSIGQVRGKGLMIGVEFVKDAETKEPAKHLRDRVVHYAFERGLLINRTSSTVVRLLPPYIIDASDVDVALPLLEAAIVAVGGTAP